MDIRIGNTTLNSNTEKIEGTRVIIEGEVFYKITNPDLMRPFLMSIVSDSDHWMFISSNGSLTAGRKNSHHALFPYETDDKISDMSEVTGSKTLLRVSKAGQVFLWEPFSKSYAGIYRIRRSVYKSELSDAVRFEEINNDLGLRIEYTWYHGEKFGFIKNTRIINLSEEVTSMEVIDGLQNLMPSGVSQQMQEVRSNLVNAYKKNELLPNSGLGVYSLSANIVDRPEPSESLTATIAWATGIEHSTRLISSLQLDAFRKGEQVKEEIDIRAERGAYFIKHETILKKGESRDWIIGADVNKGTTEVADFSLLLEKTDLMTNLIWDDVREGKKKLRNIVNSADGLQVSSDYTSSSRHASNVMFNVMRGGIFDNGYSIEKNDFLKFVNTSNHDALEKYKLQVNELPSTFQLTELIQWARDSKQTSLIRFSYEYLPLYFSRRHGDPSRPWNVFSINTKAADGSKVLNYEGNWRDIFQNWEALAISYPSFVEGMVIKFLNASTADGYNPYRITRNGIDWEVVEPHDPWSFIGYWGDHQIIYLLKLLEGSAKYHPGKLQKLLQDKIFSLANVPYRIKAFNQLAADPRDTISYDTVLAEQIDARVKEKGADGKLLWNKSGEVHTVSLLEKLLIPLLAKLSNFVPEGGIWLNTQRPEWNDANNALVGNGLSMVTLYYIRRYVSFLSELLDESQASEFTISAEVYTWHQQITTVLSNNINALKEPINDKLRKDILQALGLSAQEYNQKVYQGYSEDEERITMEALQKLLKQTLSFVDHSIEANKRTDNLYHAYNLLSIDSDKCRIDHLYEMLEGQVAILSSGYVSGQEALSILDAMKKSKLFRPDQYSYLLYPDRDLPRFLEKNTVDEVGVNNSAILTTMLTSGDFSIIARDQAGKYHFHADLKNAKDLKQRLKKVNISTEEEEKILTLYEKTFNHKEFTGRSGTFFGYEGLKSIYWHMVSKLLLAVQENIYWCIDKGEEQPVIDRLIQHYFEIRAGIGYNKSPELYGAFPTDPYSHTPGNKGAQQPGMTGQVKEDIISRFGELGVQITEGCVSFREDLLRSSEFLEKSTMFHYVNNAGQECELTIEKDSLCFTLCQIPVVYKISRDSKEVNVEFEDDEPLKMGELKLTTEISDMVFKRDSKIKCIHVHLKPRLT